MFPVLSRAANQPVAARVTEEGIAADATHEDVVSGTARQLVGAGAAREVVIPSSALNLVFPRAGADHIPSANAGYLIGASLGDDDIAAGVAQDEVEGGRSLNRRTEAMAVRSRGVAVPRNRNRVGEAFAFAEACLRVPDGDDLAAVESKRARFLCRSASGYFTTPRVVDLPDRSEAARPDTRTASEAGRKRRGAA